MSYSELVHELNLEDSILAASRMHGTPGCETTVPHHCIFQAFHRVLHGETLILKRGSCGCKGFDTNSGLLDEMPSIPGGYGKFLSYGAGEGFRPGERLKCSPAVAEAYYHKLPQDVMDGCDAIRLEPYREGMQPDLVISFVTPDQLSALAFLHDFRSADHDNIMVPTVAGCASLFRIPLAELQKSRPRAVLGNVDLASRPHMEEALLAFTVPGDQFLTMLEDTETCFLHAPFWRSLRKRIENQGKDGS